MVHTAQRWLPILLAAIGVFVASSLIHMVFKWHNADYLKLPNEDGVRGALGPLPAGQYKVPYCQDMKEMQTPEMQKKMVDGPIAMIMVWPSGLPKMGAHLAKWFALNVAIAIAAAHLAVCLTAVNGSRIFHVVALTTFLAYSAGSVSDGIWYGRTWRSVSKDLLDALIYAVVSGAVFAWLWPSASA
jgi:hypothetical protein